MNHWVIAPMIVPMLVALVLLVSDRPRLRWLVVILGAFAGTALVVWLYSRSRLEGMEIYQPGNIVPPMGAVLVLDKLASLMLGVMTILHLMGLAQIWVGCDIRQRPMALVSQHLLQAGLCGAVLAGDLVSLTLCWSLALAGLAGLAPRFRPMALAGIGAGLGALAVASGGPFVLADMAEQGNGGIGLALLAPALWLTGYWAMLTTGLNGTALGLAATAIIGRFCALVPVGPWFLPVVLGLALCLAAILTISRWQRSATALALVAGLAGVLALYLFSQATVWSTVAAIKLMAGLAMLAVATTVTTTVTVVLGSALVQTRRSALLALGLCLAAPALLMAVIPGAYAAFSTGQITAIARQLHQPALYTVAVMGFADDPKLAP